MSKKAIIRWIKKLGSLLIAFVGFLSFLGVTLWTFSTIVDSFFPNQSNFQILQTSISALAVFVTLVFYLGLFYLYRQIKNIQEMERRPLVEPADYSFEGDVVDVWLSNYGRGSATQMELELEIVEPTDLPIDVDTEQVPLYREGERGMQGETSIPPERELVKFRTTPALKVENEDGEMTTYLNWGAAVKPLHHAGVDEVRFNLRVNFSNQLGERDSVWLMEKPRGLGVNVMGRLEEDVYGVPHTKGGGATTVETKMVESVDGLIQNNRLGESSENILRKIASSGGSLPLSEIGVFLDQNVQERVCEQLFYYDLLEKTDAWENVVTATGPKDEPAEYELTEKGEEYLDKIGG